jgi:hypothetical protein
MGVSGMGFVDESTITRSDLPCLEIPVPLCVDGRRYIAGLRLNSVEHSRRQQVGLGAAASTGLLHALWELPYGISFPYRSFSEMDCMTLMEADDRWVQHTGNDFVRMYQPAGAIKSITASDRSLARAVDKAASHPPTVRRTAIWNTSTDGRSPKATATLLKARLLGVGVLAFDGIRTHELVETSEAERGRPAVFRWWQAELAYRNWINRTTPTE